MLTTSNTPYDYEHYGDLAIDFGSSYWLSLTDKYIDSSKWRAIGFKFSINNSGKFYFYIWATPLGAKKNENDKTPLKKFKTNITLDEFIKSFVKLNAQAFMNRAKVDKFYELNDE